MARLVARLLLFVAVLLAPLSMTAAPAAPMQHGAGARMQHCPDQQQAPEGGSGIADCAMACAAALPATGGHQAGVDSMVAQAGPLYLPARLANHHPDIATPPPKRA